MNEIPRRRIITPSEAGAINGDYYYEFDGERSSNSYAERSGAQRALDRRVERWFKDERGV